MLRWALNSTRKFSLRREVASESGGVLGMLSKEYPMAPQGPGRAILGLGCRF